jgi:HTH-type transcriptional regulator / antitoxin HigA
MSNNIEAFAPGEYIREELDARGWSQLDLADILGRPPQAVNEIINGKRSVTPDTARALGEAFGTSAQLWMNLESAYQLARLDAPQGGVHRKAKLYQFAPVSEMQKRGWIEKTSNLDVLESQVLNFYSIKTLDEPIKFLHAARKSTDYGSLTVSQRAWLCRVKRMAEAVQVQGTFGVGKSQALLRDLSALKAEPEETRHVSKVLNSYGVRFLVLEPLGSSKIDGVCLWLTRKEPVIALSLRYDRIDWFWHTLMHECQHLIKGDGLEAPTVDTQLVGSDAQPQVEKNTTEAEADRFAASFLIEPSEMTSFIARVHPLYSRTKIAGFAKRIGVHPGIVVGQLQRQGRIPYSHSRNMLVPVKQFVIASALTDGWGRSVAV